MLCGLWGAPFPGGCPLLYLPALPYPRHLNTSRGHVSRGTDILRALRFLVCWGLESTGGFSSQRPEPFWSEIWLLGHKFNLRLFPSSQNCAERGEMGWFFMAVSHRDGARGACLGAQTSEGSTSCHGAVPALSSLTPKPSSGTRK